MTGEAISNQPNLCISQALGGQAVSVCAECPFVEAGLDPATECLPYVAAQKIVELTASNQAKDEQIGVLTTENLRYLERILGLRIDSLVEDMFTPEGLKDEILYGSAELAEKLMGDRWGAVQLDVRFLNFINGALGQNQGDSFLQHSGDRLTAITNGLVRTSPRRTEESPVDTDRRTHLERRRGAAAPGYSTQGDLLVRRGGDEFTVLLLDVDRKDMPGIARRIQRQLDIPAALKRAPDGLPFVASVGAAHVSDIKPSLLEGKDALSRYYLVDDRCNQVGAQAKKRQYASMWKRLVGDSGGMLAEMGQPADRIVAEMFITTYFRGFIRDNSDVLGPRRN